MATRVRPKAEELYEEDFYVWTEVQAGLLREQRFDALDLANLIEEVEALGRAERSRVLNNASIIIEHLLKLRHSPASEPRSGWIDTVLEHRDRLEFDLTPRLCRILEEDLSRVYAITRRRTERRLRNHGEQAAADALPTTCPYTLDQITGDWWP
ncbi:MAG: DUF29 domain-containing protein [Geminicoccaceae bacterium]